MCRSTTTKWEADQATLLAARRSEQATRQELRALRDVVTAYFAPDRLNADEEHELRQHVLATLEDR